MQKFQEEFLKWREKKETRLFKNQEKKITWEEDFFQEENYKFFQDSEDQGKNVQKRK